MFCAFDLGPSQVQRVVEMSSLTSGMKAVQLFKYSTPFLRIRERDTTFLVLYSLINGDSSFAGRIHTFGE